MANASRGKPGNDLPWNPSPAYRRRSPEPYGMILRSGSGTQGSSPRNRGSSGAPESNHYLFRSYFSDGNPAIVRMIPARDFPAQDVPDNEMISGIVSTSHCEATSSNFGSCPVCISNLNLRCSPPPRRQGWRKGGDRIRWRSGFF
jgi:hypothetical protein